MSIVLAALDTTAAARPVLETALQIGRLTGSDVEAVHVRDGRLESIETLESLAARSEVPFRLLEGPVESALLAALGAPDVLAAVIGARATPGGRRPVGRTARHILEHATSRSWSCPLTPWFPARSGDSWCPLKAPRHPPDRYSSDCGRCWSTDVELVVLHVFTDATLPAMLDRPERDLEMLGREFLTRHCPQATHIELRPGPVATRVAEVSGEQGAT